MIEKLDAIRKKREKYQRAWASDLITDEEFDERMGETKALYDELEHKIQQYTPPEKIDLEVLKDIVVTLINALKI